MSGITITDPETGATIVEIPRAAISSAWEEVQGGAGATAGAPQSDLWLLATADGETWLLQDLDESDPDEFNQPALVATNGTTVLVGKSGLQPGTDVWQRFAMTE